MTPGYCNYCLRPATDDIVAWCENGCWRRIRQLLNAYHADLREKAAYLISVAARHAKNRRNGGEAPCPSRGVHSSPQP